MPLLLQLKGQFTDLVYIILAIVSLGVLIAALIIVKGTGEDLIDKGMCYEEVRRHSQAIDMRMAVFAAEVKSCGPNPLLIADNSNANSRIASAMAGCWDSYGSGKLRLFSDEGTYCQVCDVVEFQDSGQQISGLFEYLKDNDVPNKGITYTEFLTGHSTERADKLSDVREAYDILEQENSALLGQQTLDTSKKYSVIFVYSRGEEEIKEMMDHVQGETAAGGWGNTIMMAGVVVGGVAGTVALLLTGFGAPAAVVTAAQTLGYIGLGTGAVANAAIYVANDAATSEWVSFMALREHTPESLTALGCDYAE
ncbi:hypothetical protein ACFL1B_06060 [Nanoarchaeota archaeon]